MHLTEALIYSKTETIDSNTSTIKDKLGSVIGNKPSTTVAVKDSRLTFNTTKSLEVYDDTVYKKLGSLLPAGISVSEGKGLSVYDTTVDSSLGTISKKLTDNLPKLKLNSDSLKVHVSNQLTIPAFKFDGEKLKVTTPTMPSLKFDQSGNLKVKETNSTSSTAISGTVSIGNWPTTQSVKIASSDTNVKLKIDQSSKEPLNVKITNANDVATKLSVDGDMNVTIDTEALKQAFLYALHQDTDMTDTHNNDNSLYGKLSALYDAFADGSFKIRVRNDVTGLPTIPTSTNANLKNKNWINV